MFKNLQFAGKLPWPDPLGVDGPCATTLQDFHSWYQFEVQTRLKEKDCPRVCISVVSFSNLFHLCAFHTLSSAGPHPHQIASNDIFKIVIMSFFFFFFFFELASGRQAMLNI